MDFDRRELRSAGVPVPIGSRAFDVFEVLVRSADDAVTKSELLERVWPGVVVGDNTLHVHIAAIRKSLGVDRGMLQTVGMRGYRLAGKWTTHIPQDRQGPADRIAPPLLSSNLPGRSFALIGRSTALEKLRDLLSAYRMVTLTGPGGIGKTSLALEVARERAASFGGNVWLVDLTSLFEPDLVGQSIARVIGMEIGAEVISPASVAKAIGQRKLLLVMDNCEHLIDAAARAVEAILVSCPHASILATSRELLRIDGEHDYRVPPLLVPDKTLDPVHARERSAVELFLARLEALQPDFSPSDGDVATVSAICRHLDGIPLAIEFAAARAATLGVDQVLSRLDDRFSILTSGRRTALPRHRTLRATLDWSYRLLSEEEQSLLRSLAVFPGGFMLEAVAAVTGLSPSRSDDQIARLIEKSLVVAGTSGATKRYRLLETTRQYARELLGQGREYHRASRRHAEFLCRLLPSDPLSLRPAMAIQDVAVHVAELENVRGALDWAFSAEGDAKVGIELTASYAPVWLHLSLMAECQDRVGRALQNLEAHPDLSEKDRLACYLTFGYALVVSTGAVETVETLMTRAVDIAGRLGDVDSLLRALWGLWSHRFNTGQYNSMLRLAERFSQLAKSVGREEDKLVGERLVGMSLHYLGNQTDARTHLERLALVVSTANLKTTAGYFFNQRLIARAMLARVLWLQGYLDQAREHALESYVEAQAAGDEPSLRYMLGWAICPVTIWLGDHVAAESQVKHFVGIAARYSQPFWSMVGLGLEGLFNIARGDLLAGTAALRRALEHRGMAGRGLRKPEFLGALAESLGSLGHTADGMEAIEECLRQSDEQGQRWYLAEALRIKGELLRRVDNEFAEDPQGYFLKSLAVSRQQGCLSWELKAGVSSARLWLEKSRPDEARGVLGPIYGRISEGFSTPTVESAKKLLESMASA